MLNNLFSRRDTGRGYDNIDARAYHEQFAAREHVLLDVRTVGEFMQGHAPGSVNIPLQALAARLDEVSAAPDVPVVVICRSGSRSQVGSRILAEAGYSEVYNLAGGTLAWQRHGYKLER